MRTLLVVGAPKRRATRSEAALAAAVLLRRDSGLDHEKRSRATRTWNLRGGGSGVEFAGHVSADAALSQTRQRCHRSAWRALRP
jgi:hypothetical protein